MTNSKMEELTKSTRELEQRLSDLRSAMQELKIGQPSRSAGKRIFSLPLVLGSLVVLGIAVYVAAIAAPATPPAQTPSTSLGSARVFALLSGGNVELTDPWSGRRIFRWDGRQWQLVDSPQAPGVSPLARRPAQESRRASPPD